MRRGTSSIHTFTLPVRLLQGTEIVVTYVQDGYTILEKRGDDLTIEVETVDLLHSNTIITLDITEEESLKFRKGYCNVQLRFSGASGTGATNICHFEVKDTLSEEVLSG